MSKRRKKFPVLIAIAALVAILTIAALQLVPESPLKEVELARISLSEAGKNRADTYSGKFYREAKANYDSAMSDWKKENERFLLLRDYSRVKEFAGISVQKSLLASENSLENSASLKTRLEIRLDTLESLVSGINTVFGSYPLEAETRSRISQGKMLLKESGIAFEKGEYLEAFRKITDSEYLLATSYETAYENLKSYFRSFPQWREWTEKAIKNSRVTGEYSIIVDKFSHKLYVYQKGVRKMEFEAEMGKNWVGDKRVRGDMATPEGMYKIVKKLGPGSTKYHKALLLDYPNAEDKARFRREVENGSIPGNAGIGGLIEIHGHGGRGTDWTEGCIALTDSEMDTIFKIAKTGTPVTIVGSMTELSKLLDN
jgi:L,D-peptidoglycan transpeptidase YkuD (ErfK/YbiS/YcfS/YnhG family)